MARADGPPQGRGYNEWRLRRSVLSCAPMPLTNRPRKDHRADDKPRASNRGAIAMILLGIALAMATAAQAEPADDAEFAALQASAKKAFKDGVAPFVKNY